MGVWTETSHEKVTWLFVLSVPEGAREFTGVWVGDAPVLVFCLRTDIDNIDSTNSVQSQTLNLNDTF